MELGSIKFFHIERMIMAKPNPNQKWGVIVGEPKPEHPNPDRYRSQIGQFCTHFGVVRVYLSKAEAEVCRDSYIQDNPFWNYHIKRYTPPK